MYNGYTVKVFWYLQVYNKMLLKKLNTIIQFLETHVLENWIGSCIIF